MKEYNWTTEGKESSEGIVNEEGNEKGKERGGKTRRRKERMRKAAI